MVSQVLVLIHSLGNMGTADACLQCTAERDFKYGEYFFRLILPSGQLNPFYQTQKVAVV